jgi:hypothetical protein
VDEVTARSCGIADVVRGLAVDLCARAADHVVTQRLMVQLERQEPMRSQSFVPESDIDRVASHIDAARIVERMLADLRAHPQEWENATLERFLE